MLNFVIKLALFSLYVPVALSNQGGTAGPQTYIIFTDSFNDGELHDWYKVGVVPPVLESVDTPPLTSYALGWSWSNSAVLKSINAPTLESAGDYLELRCDVLYLSVRQGFETGLSLALYDAKGTQVYADADVLAPAAQDDVGYKFFKSLQSGSADINLISNRGFARVLVDGQPNVLLTASSGQSVSTGTPYSASFKITRLQNGDLRLESGFNGTVNSYTVPANEVLSYTFDEIGIHPFAGEYASRALIDNVVVTSNLPPEASRHLDSWKQPPPNLTDPLVVSNYNSYGNGSLRTIDGRGGDVLMLAHAPNGSPKVLKNVQVEVQNFRRLHIRGLDLEVDDPDFERSRALLIRTTGRTPFALAEEVFIEGLRIENNFTHSNTDAIAVYYLGVENDPVERFVLQNSRITGVGTPGKGDTLDVHPDILQFQGGVFVDHVYIESFTGNTMYQGIYAPWNQNVRTAYQQPSWSLREVNLSSEDPFTNRLFVTQDEGRPARDYPQTSFVDVYLAHTEPHPWGVGSASIHVNPKLEGNNPYLFVSEARISGTPVPGRAPTDYAPRDRVGIYYVSPHGDESARD